jgi:heme-degrading monooxygenase HmoA
VYWIVWSYDVKPEQTKSFERVYGSDGDWVRLFVRAPGYVGTEMRRESERVNRYFTIDRWRTRADYQRFKETFRDEYQTLDARCAAMTEAEQKVGDFETHEGSAGGGN